MHKITFTCETITPMFLSGADGSTPELRAPSIKGALRFWWRALNGHLVERNDDEWDYSPLLKEDKKLWGGVSNNNQKKSSVSVRISFNEDIAIISIDAIKKKSEKGLQYLFYSLMELQKGRYGLDVNNQFNITLSSKSENDLLKASASFWVFLYLGSLGSRSRRGAGSISIKTISGNINIIKDKLTFNLPEPKGIANFLSSNLNYIKGILSIPNSLSQHSKEYSVLNQAPIYVSKEEFGSWSNALNDIGQRMFIARTGKPDKNRANREFTMFTLDQKAAFGLPVRVRGGKWGDKGQWVNDNEVNFTSEYQRRASPIWISLIKNINGKFHWVVVYLQGEFMPPDASIIFKTKNPDVSPKEYPFSSVNNQTLEGKFLKRIESITTKLIIN